MDENIEHFLCSLFTYCFFFFLSLSLSFSFIFVINYAAITRYEVFVYYKSRVSCLLFGSGLLMVFDFQSKCVN